ncbi:MAG: DNA-3-methyladenine glycosylase [Alphaproteobacteria bacterium]|jgi:DNA-3-methyladenine glycosylase|nr:DNA-3-methyladenine glycosylase [Alphaproteobacteria bacterium]
MKLLDKNFFLQPTLTVAKELISKTIHIKNNQSEYQGIITETEAYFGNDPASHGFCGLTKRNAPMFNSGGIAYVYIIYGIHHCLNFVCEDEGYPAAVLVRGINIIQDNKVIKLDGPGKVCKFLGIDRTHNNKSLTDGSFISVYDTNTTPKIKATKRIGISKNTEALWRFVLDS